MTITTKDDDITKYKEKIRLIFNQMDDVNKLRFWYKYISAIEGG